MKLKLKVVEIFNPIQGEGAMLVNRPLLFVYLTAIKTALTAILTGMLERK
jgi:hypothetical protein